MFGDVETEVEDGEPKLSGGASPSLDSSKLKGPCKAQLHEIVYAALNWTAV